MSLISLIVSHLKGQFLAEVRELSYQSYATSKHEKYIHVTLLCSDHCGAFSATGTASFYLKLYNHAECYCLSQSHINAESTRT